MDKASRHDRDARVARWMDLFREAAERPEFQVPADGARPFDFNLRAPDEGAARALASWLRTHTTYHVDVHHTQEPDESSGALLDGWRVGGQTPPLDPAPRVFEQWLTFLIGAGVGLGCELEACSGIDLAQEMPTAA